MSGPDALPSPLLQPVKTAVSTLMHFSVVHLKLQLIIGCRVLSVVMSPPWWAKVRHDGSRLVLASFYRGPAPPPAEGGRVKPSVPPPSPWEESATTQIYFVAATRQRGGRNQWTHFPCQVTNAPDVTRIMGGGGYLRRTEMKFLILHMSFVGGGRYLNQIHKITNSTSSSFGVRSKFAVFSTSEGTGF